MFRSVIVDSQVIYLSSSQAGMRNIPRGKTSRKSCFKALHILCHPTFNELGDWFGCLLLQEIKSSLQIRQLSLTICSAPIFQRWEWAWKQMVLPSSVWDGICCCATPLTPQVHSLIGKAAGLSSSTAKKWRAGRKLELTGVSAFWFLQSNHTLHPDVIPDLGIQLTVGSKLWEKWSLDFQAH